MRTLLRIASAFRPWRLSVALLALGGCKYLADVGPRPYVMPAYPVQNLPPVPPQQPYPAPDGRSPPPPQPGAEPNSGVRRGPQGSPVHTSTPSSSSLR